MPPTNVITFDGFEVFKPLVSARYGEKTDAGKDGRQAEKGQTSNDLVPGFERVDQAGHCWCITTGDRSGKMAKNHQSHSSANSAT